MGVLACDRRGCDNIMCDNLSHTYGYLCRECLEELKDNPMTDIEAFMGNPREKVWTVNIQRAWEEMIDEEFKERD